MATTTQSQHVQTGIPVVSNVNYDQASIFQGMPQQYSAATNHTNLIAQQPNQITYVLVPAMNLFDQNRQPVAGAVYTPLATLIPNILMHLGFPRISVCISKQCHFLAAAAVCFLGQ